MEQESPILVIFGITGDLAQRKIIPALHALHAKGIHLPVIGVGRKAKSAEDFHADIATALSKAGRQEPTLEFLSHFTYHQGEFHSEKSYAQLKTLVADRNAIYYLSIPPNLFGTVAKQLKAAGLCENAKVAFEKPFGSDLRSAEELNTLLMDAFKEEQVYRVDHFTGKSSIQNILALRFANTMLEPVLHRAFIDHIQITAAEEIGVEDRGAYYERAGALRDMVQNHLLQTLAFIMMDRPKAMDAQAIHESKATLLNAIERIDKFSVQERTARGQYVNANGKVAYREEEDVAFDSATETYVALKLTVNNERWRDVPVYIRTGKRMQKRSSYATIVFRPPMSGAFNGEKLMPNKLTIHITPVEDIMLTINNKTPESKFFVTPVDMSFSHAQHFGPNTPEAYERLIEDMVRSDKTLFPTWEEVKASWDIVQPILDAWRMVVEVDEYPAGTNGPSAATKLIQKDGREWL